MAGTLSGWVRWSWFRSLTRRTSAAVAGEVWRVGFSSAAPQDLEGATAWIDVGDRWINGMGRSWVYYWIDVAIQGPSDLTNSIWVWGVSKLQIRSLSVMGQRRVAYFDDLELMGTPFSDTFLSFFLLLRFVCVFSYHSWYQKACPGWLVGTDQLEWVCTNCDGRTVVILSDFGCCRIMDQLGWVCDDGDDGLTVVILSIIWFYTVTDQLEWVCDGLVVVILPVRWYWILCGSGSMSWRCSMHGRPAVYGFYLLSFNSVGCASGGVMIDFFPCFAYHGGVKLHVFGSGLCIWCALFVIKRWYVFIKWLLPPSVKMKRKVIISFFNSFYWPDRFLLISFVRLSDSLQVPKIDIAFRLFFNLIRVDDFRQTTCYLHKFIEASCFFIDQLSLYAMYLSGLYWHSLSISIAPGRRWSVWLFKWKLPPSGKMKCVDGISVRQHRRKVILSDLLSHSGGFSLLVCRHYIQAIEDAVCALLAIWCLLEYFVVIETIDSFSIWSHCNMGFRLYVPPLYSTVSLLDGF